MEKIFEKILNQSLSEKRHKNSRLNEALTKKQKRDIIDYIKEHSFFPLINNYSYFIVPIDDEHIKMSTELREQLENDGLYGEGVISGILPSSEAKLPISTNWLPIFGSSNRFQTKWICNFYDTCFARDLRDRAMRLSARLDIEKIK